jgi:hypothetical protein
MLQGWPVLGNGNRAAAHATAARSSDDAIATIRSQKAPCRTGVFQSLCSNSARADLLFVTFSHAHLETYEKAVGEFERRYVVHVQFQYADWHSLQSRLQNAMLARADVPDMVEVLEGSLGFFTRGPPSPHLGILWELPEDLKGRPGARRSRRPCAFCIGEERHSISVLFTPRYGLINRTVQALFRWGLERLSG